MLCVSMSAASHHSLPSGRVPSVWGRIGTAFVMSTVLLLASGCSIMQKDPAQPREVQAGTVSVTTANPDSFTPVAAAQKESKAARRAQELVAIERRRKTAQAGNHLRRMS